MRKGLYRLGAVMAAMLAAAPRLLAQGCAMCYSDAAAQSPRARQQLDLAILTLLIPSVTMFAGVLIAAFRRREHEMSESENLDVIQPRGDFPQAADRVIPSSTAPDQA